MKKVTPQHIAQVLFESTQGRESKELSQDIKEVSQLIKTHGFLSRIDEIVNEYHTIYNAHHNIKEVTITLQERLSFSRKEEVKEELKKILNCNDVYLKEKIDERIIGGIKIEASDGLFIDGTVQGRLTQLRKILAR